MPIMFRFRWIPFIAAMLAVAAGIALGRWQTRRALEKEAIEARLTARGGAPRLNLNTTMPSADEAEYRRVQVTGEFMRDWPIYLDNRPYNGVAGFYLLMPFKITGSSRYVLVERGWIRRDFANRTKLPPLTTPDGETALQGLAVRHPGRLLQLGSDAALRPGAVRENLNIAEFGRASGLNMLPLVIEQTSDTHDGLIRDWPRPSTGIERHRGYAFQWYALATMAFLFFVVTGFRRGTKQAASTE